MPFNPIKAPPVHTQRRIESLPPALQETIVENYTLNLKANSRDEYIQALDEAQAQALINLGRDEAFEQGGYSV
jgi:ABC-type transport system involved in cytochrome bd biosynthesis fused ATPase/permease subunit